MLSSKKEKRILIIVFTLFFIFSALLVYFMIMKDMRKEYGELQKREHYQVIKDENVWPKVEIETRK